MLFGLSILFLLAGCSEKQEASPIIVEAKPVEYTVVEEVKTLPSTEETLSDEVVTFTITCVGDCSLGNHMKQDYPGSFYQMYDQQGADYFFADVRDIFEADDMTIVNLEGVLTDSNQATPNRTFNIKGPSNYVNILSDSFVEAVSMGNNHRMDYGEKGVADTISALTEKGIVYAYDGNIGVFEKNGIRVGFFSVNEASSGKSVEKWVTQDIESLKEKQVDLILACCHWGTEKDYYPESYQRQLGKMCIDLGADLVIGHHPHVLQGIEAYKGKNIIYSLGNFCFGANKNPTDKDSVIYAQTFTFVNGVLQEDLNVSLTPVRISSVNERNDYRPTVAEGLEGQRILDKIATYSQFDTE